MRFLRVILSAASLLCASLSSRAQTTAATYHDRADQALQNFLLKFWSGGQQYLLQNFPNTNNQLTGYWTYAHGWEAAMDGVERTGREQYLGWIETFYLGQNERGWIVGYYDDECWMAMALLRAYDLTGNVKYLSEAKTLMADIEGGWDTSCCGSVKGGVWWDKAHTQKATASNAGAALVAARLYRRTGIDSYLTFAQQAYSYWLANMVNTSTYQVCDHMNPDGTKVWWKFTYNEGLMIAAALELNDATGAASYLSNAQSIANFMTANEVTSTAYGSVLYDGSNTGCGGDCHEFKAPAFRYLTRLCALTNRTAYLNVLKGSADAIWNLARDTTANTFAVNWAGPAQSAVDQAQESAAVVALNRFAQQYGSFPDSGAPMNRFEAENATLHHVGLEANYTGFTGWGYVAGWNSDNTSIDFSVNIPSTATHTVTIRFAAGAGNATRQILINGANRISNQTFANTGAWTTYNTITFTQTFSAGVNFITLKYNSALGSGNFLNVDNLTIPTLTPAPPGPLLLTNSLPNPALTWTSPGFLQTATNIFGPWLDANGNPSSPATLFPSDLTNANKFFRLRQ